MNSHTPPEAVGRLVTARELVELATALGKTGAATASGLWGSSVAAAVAGVSRELKRPIVLVCGHIDEADDLADDVELFTGSRPEVVPTLELTGAMGQLSEEQVSNRLRLISRLASVGATKSRGGDTRCYKTVLAPIQSLMQAVPSRDQLGPLSRALKAGEEIEAEKLIVSLSDHGYNRLDQVEVPGDFAVRGGIVDIYLPGDFEDATEVAGESQIGLTVRVDFFGDQIESIKRFDLDTMGSGKKLESVRLIDLKGQVDVGSSTHLFSYLPKETIVVLWAPLEIAEQAKSYLDRLPEVKGIYPLSAVLKNIAHLSRLELSQFDQNSVAMPSFISSGAVPHFVLPVTSLQKFETEAKKAIGELAELANDHDVTVFCENAGELNRFSELLNQDAPGLKGRVKLATGYLHRGFVWGANVRSTPAPSPGL